MEPTFWHERWARAEIGFHQHETNIHLRRFWPGLGLTAGQRILVPLCGKSLDLLWLAGEGQAVTGVEISPVAVAAFFADNDLRPRRWRQGAFEVWQTEEIRILLGDFFALQPDQIADCAAAYDRAALIALPPAMRERYARHLAAILPPAAPMLLVTLEYDQTLLSGPPFAVCEEEVRALYGSGYQIEPLHARDALAEESRWRERGLTWLLERVYRLTPRLAANPP